MLRKEAGQARTCLVNQIRHILRRHNLQWDMPTKKFPTKAGIAWLKQRALPEIDRLEMNYLLTDLEQVQQRRQELEQVMAQRCGVSAEAVLLSSIPASAWGALPCEGMCWEQSRQKRTMAASRREATTTETEPENETTGSAQESPPTDLKKYDIRSALVVRNHPP